MFFITISALNVSGGISAYHQEFMELYVQPWVLSCFPVVCRWVGTVQQESMTIPKAAHSFISS
jgi:hypothetical protein